MRLLIWTSSGHRWHTLLFEGQVVVNMRMVCPQDVKQMLLKQARMVYWKKWAAKHEHEGAERRSMVRSVPNYAAKKHM